VTRPTFLSFCMEYIDGARVLGFCQLLVILHEHVLCHPSLKQCHGKNNGLRTGLLISNVIFFEQRIMVSVPASLLQSLGSLTTKMQKNINQLSDGCLMSDNFQGPSYYHDVILI
jgi:hypothetical protein